MIFKELICPKLSNTYLRLSIITGGLVAYGLLGELGLYADP